MAVTPELALISVSNKWAILELAKCLRHHCKVNIIASDGTCKHLLENGIEAERVGCFNESAEMCGGRVKTLHPKLFAGILCGEEHLEELATKNWPRVKFVVCNFYPFEKTICKPLVSDSEALENVDIGGVALVRAAAKNHKFVTVITDVSDYEKVIEEVKQSSNGNTTLETRRMLAIKAFQMTNHYDSLISNYMCKTYLGCQSVLPLRYGMNPHQRIAEVTAGCLNSTRLPFSVLNGSPSYINIMDALNAWQLVRDLRAALNVPSAASFKHVSPAGAAIGTDDLTELERKVFMVDATSLSRLATAYAKARGCDRLSSFGDFIALSDQCDVETAKLIVKDVSDGIIAPDFHPEAIKLLERKKDGNYCVLKIDANYEPDEWDERTVFGVRLKQQRNSIQLNKTTLFPDALVEKNYNLKENVQQDLILASVTCKYTQSNSVCLAVNGQTIGIGSGQQSRIGCVRLACEKADNWWLRFHQKVNELRYVNGTKRAEKNNIIDAYIRAKEDDFGEFEFVKSQLQTPALLLSETEKKEWITKLSNVSMSSDGFFPFVDCIRRARKSGVKSIVVPSGSKADDIIKAACEEYDIQLAFTNIRLFHH